MEREESRSVIIYYSYFFFFFFFFFFFHHSKTLLAPFPLFSRVPVSSLQSTHDTAIQMTTMKRVLVAVTAGSEEMILQYLGLKKGIMSSLVLCVTRKWKHEQKNKATVSGGMPVVICTCGKTGQPFYVTRRPEKKSGSITYIFTIILTTRHCQRLLKQTSRMRNVLATPTVRMEARLIDGSEIDGSVIQHIRATAWECAVGFQWRSGDLF